MLSGGQVLELGYVGYKLDQFIGWDEWSPQSRKLTLYLTPFVLGYPVVVGLDYLVGMRYWDEPTPSPTLYYTRSEILLLYQTAMDNYFYNVLGRHIGFNYAVNRGVYRIGVGGGGAPGGGAGAAGGGAAGGGAKGGPPGGGKFGAPSGGKGAAARGKSPGKGKR